VALLCGGDVLGTGALGVLYHTELDTLSLIECTESLGLDRAIVDKDVLATLASDKAITFGVAEPLDRSMFALCHRKTSWTFSCLGSILTGDDKKASRANADS
jgi:hypothetical protein